MNEHRLSPLACGGGLLKTTKVNRMKAKDAAKLNEEYQRLVRGLTESGVIAQPSQADAMPANPGRCPSTGIRGR